MSGKYYLRTLQVLLLSIFIFATVSDGTAQEKFRLSGYGNMHLMAHDGMPKFVGQKHLDDSFFQLREFSLFFDFALTDEIIASTELEAGDNGNRYTANYAYIDIQARDNLSFRAGKILVPFLSYNENKPNFRQNLMSQPFTAWNLVPVNGTAIDFRGFGWSDAGVVGNWNNLLGDWGIIDLKASVINGLGSDSNILDDNTVKIEAAMMMGEMPDGDTGDMPDGDTGDMGDMPMDGPVFPTVRPRDGLIQNEINNELRDNNNDKATVAKLTFKSIAHPLDLGVSWYRGAWDPDGKKDLQLVGAHLNWLAARWTLKGEYVVADVEQDGGINSVEAAGLMGPADINTTTGDYSMQAWYVEGSCTPVVWERDRYLKLVLRLDDVDTNDKAVFTPFDRGRITAGAEWQFALNTRLRYEWQRTKIEDFDKAPLPFRNAGGKEEIKMNMASMIFSF